MIGSNRHDIASHGNAPPSYDRDDVLTIALVNNMPDTALRATERQFCALLSAASDGMLVRLKLYATPGIVRSEAARTHIARYYEDFSELETNPPDGIIVTGTEPRARALPDEPFWPALSWLIDWVDDHAIPGIWSCLGAHAAVLQLDGVQRQALGGKISGLFECRVSAHKHHILHGLPTVWRVPHSRHYGLRENSLMAAGYTILSRSRDVGADIFLRQGHALQLFFQGHPEYGAATLLSEYRRDVARFLNGERNTYPVLPRGYCGATAAARFAHFAAQARGARTLDALPALDALMADVVPQHGWSTAARRIYINWLCYVSEIRARRHTRRRTAMPAELAAHVGV
jgi:homoserine O-succinyltransferase